MTTQQAANNAHIRAQIARLDQEREDRLQGQYTGNKGQIRDQIAANMKAEQDFQKRRAELVRLLESEEISPAVQEYINPKNQKPASKFDLDEGKENLDNSLNPLGGKSL